MLFQDLENIIKKYMLLEDKGIVKLLCAYVVALRIPIPPPWLFILGASSGGKSMLLNSLAQVRGYRALDDVTSASFLSGSRGGGEEMSLLHNLPKECFLVFKDFTTILSKQKESRGAIIGLLRKIYDGEMSKKTGNISATNNWEGKIGVLGGSTSSFYTKMADFADMGERTLAYIFQQPSKRDLGERIFEDGLNDFEAKETMRKAFKTYLDDSDINIPPKVSDLPKFDRQTKDDILDLAELTTTARSGVERNFYDRDAPVMAKHFEEQIARFQKEIMALSYGFMLLNQHDTGQSILLPQDKKTLYAMALDTIPYNRRLILVQMAKLGFSSTEKSLSEYLGLDEKAIKIALGDMRAHGMFISHASHSGISWELNPKWQDIIKKFEYMDMTPIEVKKEIENKQPLTSEENLTLTQAGLYGNF